MTPQHDRTTHAQRTSPKQTPRLRLKPKAPHSGYVDGAWWPHTRNLSTELPDLRMARQFGEAVRYDETGTGNSGHFYVDRDGAIHRYVDIARTAHHTRGYNPRSIGIELVNRGRYPDWLDSCHQAMEEPYTDAQLDAFVALLRHLQAAAPSLKWIAGHDDLD